jgi:hypothetical protein
MAQYKSQARDRYFSYLESQGKMPKKMDREFGESNEYEEMPEQYAYGGMVEEEEEDLPYDYVMGHSRTPVSSGEPNTEFDFEDDHPMEYMNKGGMIKRMSKGGMVPRHPGFVKALRKASY